LLGGGVVIVLCSDPIAEMYRFVEYRKKFGVLSTLQEKQKWRKLGRRRNSISLRENCDLLACDTIYLVIFIPTSWRKRLSPSSV
jgi:hypothetical protein